MVTDGGWSWRHHMIAPNLEMCFERKAAACPAAKQVTQLKKLTQPFPSWHWPGFLAIMLNFNNERMSMAVGACRMSRCCLEDAIRRAGLRGPVDDSLGCLCDRYARKRKVFGKPLIQQQVSWYYWELGWRVVAVITLKQCNTAPELVNNPTA